MSHTNISPEFQPFNQEGDLRVYVRNLPHWRQVGAAYFVTIRQNDSIPTPVHAEWLDIRNRWYQANGIDPRWQQSSPDRLDAAYAAIPDGVRRAFERAQARMLHIELDRCHGSCVLQYDAPRKTVCESLLFFHGQRLWMGDYVVMPNHIHAIVVPFDGWDLEDLLGSIKKWTSRLISKWLETQQESNHPSSPTHNKARFWQHESYDRIVRDVDELTRFRTYVAANPQTANLPVDQYAYHPAVWLDQSAVRPTVET